MKINIGYVAISMKLKEASPNKTTTLKNLSKIDKSLWQGKVEALARQNLLNTIRILKYNSAYGIKFYRFTSKLIPFATHPEFKDWDWKNNLKDEFKEIGEYVKKNDMRVDTHPDHFVLINSPREEVFETSVRDIDYHCSMYELMGLDNSYKMVIHVGGMYKNKEDSLKRFYEGFYKLDERLRSRLMIENDDKIYNAEDVLNICRNINVPMVLDVHHDMCNPSHYSVENMVSDIFSTWSGEKFPPKIHVSSPKSEKSFRSHDDFIHLEDFISFINKVRGLKTDFDAMLEAKMKDEAVFKLMEDIKTVNYIKKISGATIEVV